METKIRVERLGNLLRITPPSTHIYLAKKLTWAYSERVPGPRGKLSFKPVSKPLYTVTDNYLMTFCGFKDTVVSTLSQFGTVEYIDSREDKYKKLPKPQIDNLKGFRYKQDEAINTMWSSDFGIINCITGFGKTELISKFVLSLPYRKILIVGPGKAELDTIEERLKSYGITPGRIDSKNKKWNWPLITTMQSLKAVDGRGWLKEATEVLFDEVHRASAPSAYNALMRCKNARLFGFSATVDGKSNNSEVVVEAMFGKPICTVNYQEGVENNLVVPMKTIFISTSGPANLERVLKATNNTTKERWGIWRNTNRNQEIAAVASQVVELGQTLVLTYTLEHAIYLHKEFPPGWVLMYGTDPETALKSELNKQDDDITTPVSRDARRYQNLVNIMRENGVEKLTENRKAEIQEKFRSGEIKGVIATKIWSQAVDFPKLQFVIQASAMASSILSRQSAGRSSRISEGKTTGIVIDCEDNFFVMFKNRKDSRIKTYKKLGWEIKRNINPQEVGKLCQTLL